MKMLHNNIDLFKIKYFEQRDSKVCSVKFINPLYIQSVFKQVYSDKSMNYVLTYGFTPNAYTYLISKETYMQLTGEDEA